MKLYSANLSDFIRRSCLPMNKLGSNSLKFSIQVQRNKFNAIKLVL